MTDIKDCNQQPASDDLSSDSEIYMKDLSEDELNQTHGGDGDTDIVIDAISAAAPVVKPFAEFVKKFPGNPEATAAMQANR